MKQGLVVAANGPSEDERCISASARLYTQKRRLFWNNLNSKFDQGVFSFGFDLSALGEFFAML